MQDPSVVNNIDPKSFFEEYKALTADTDGCQTPATAIMIHLTTDDAVAVQVMRGVLTLAVSFAASFVAKLLAAIIIGN